MDITVDLPDRLVEILKKKADGNRRQLSDEIVRQLESVAQPSDLSGNGETGWGTDHLREEGVLARDDEKSGPEFEMMAEGVSDEEFEKLRLLFSQGTSLSEMIIEDRR